MVYKKVQFSRLKRYQFHIDLITRKYQVMVAGNKSHNIFEQNSLKAGMIKNY